MEQDYTKLFNTLNNSIQNSDGIDAEILKKTGIDPKLWEEMINIQKQFNTQVHPEWEKQNFNFKLAMFIETCELIDSFDWKWWKHSFANWENVEIEMVDIFLFMLSQLIINNNTTIPMSFFIAKELKNESIRKKDKKLETYITKKLQEEFIFALSTNNIINTVLIWIGIWYELGYNFINLYKLSKMKSTLNQFRQENGYQDGTYIKIWNSEEDNIVAQRLIKNMSVQEIQENLLSELQTEYSKVNKDIIKNKDNFILNDQKWNNFFVNVPKENREILFTLLEDFQKYLN